MLTRRDVRLPAVPGKALAVIGVRRSGKTTYLWQCLTERMSAGTARDALIMLGLEDDRPYDLIRDSLVDLGFGLVRMEQRRQMLEDLFRDQEPEAGDGASS